MEQFAQRRGGSPIPGDIQSQAAAASQQSNLTVNVPVHHSGVGLDDLYRSLPTVRTV